MEIIAKGTKVRIVKDVAANSVKVGDVRTVVARFELPESQGGRHYRLASNRTASGYTGPMVPADAIEVVG